MLITAQLIGDGTDSDPYRVNLPTYTLVDVDYAAMTATVDVPAEDAPPPLAPLAAWHAILDDRYQEHAGKFRPQLP